MFFFFNIHLGLNSYLETISQPQINLDLDDAVQFTKELLYTSLFQLLFGAGYSKVMTLNLTSHGTAAE